VEVEYHDYAGLDAREVGKEVVAVHAESFAQEAYYRCPRDRGLYAVRFAAVTQRPGFRLVTATATEAGVVGFGYGLALTAVSGVWGDALDPLRRGLSIEDQRQTFAVLELAVFPAYRRRRIARHLHDALLASCGEARARLSVHADAEAALCAYRSWGYRRIDDCPDNRLRNDPYQVLGLPLPPRKADR
jgi:ribosomal protein S18 acetylase RimI-like enzyme